MKLSRLVPSFLSNRLKSAKRFVSKLNPQKEKTKPNERLKLSSTHSKKVRIMPGGSGGTIRAFTSDCNHVGVHGCQSCVGVYFALDENHCFVAHIDCRIGASRKTAGGLRLPDQATYDRLKQDVFRRLDEERLIRRWGAKTDVEFMDLLRGTLVMVCKQLDPRVAGHREPGWDTVAGNVVAEAVNEWLEIPRGEWVVPERCGGFIVRHREYEPQYWVTQIDMTEWTSLEQEQNMKWCVTV
ncbi:hypothetical protein LTR08_005874 [Meristemomyces frigidus]|nr:hypothetical protein LTR08_005874 [Meristemomyces frigidus]